MTDDYPDDDELEKIKKWRWDDSKGLMEYVCDLWRDYGFIKQDENIYELSTGGWSGNEDIIGALQENTMFWAMYWWSSRRGGHYEFRVRNIK